MEVPEAVHQARRFQKQAKGLKAFLIREPICTNEFVSSGHTSVDHFPPYFFTRPVSSGWLPKGGWGHSKPEA